MNSIEIGHFILNARQDRGWSQEDLAEAAGKIGQSTIDRIEKGSFKRMPSALPAICDALGLPLPMLGDDTPDTRSMITKPLMGLQDFRVYAAAEGGEGEIIRTTDLVEVIARPAVVQHVREAYGLVITGESMVPEYRPGETAIVNPALPAVGGEVHIFYTELQGEARATIKFLRRASPTEWMVTQHNPPPRKPKDFILPRREWRWAHRVVGKYTRR